MFRKFADVQTAEMLNLPCPRLAGGKATVVACPMSEEQKRLQLELVARYDRLRSQKELRLLPCRSRRLPRMPPGPRMRWLDWPPCIPTN